MTSHRLKNQKLRLLHIQLLPLMSGVQKVTLDEFRGLSEDRYEFHLICQCPGPLTEQVEALGGTVYYCEHLVREISVKDDILALSKLRRQIKAINPHIVHTHSSKTGILGRLASRLAGVPAVVHTVHGFAFPLATSRSSKVLFTALEYVSGKLCDALVVLNRSDFDIARRKLKVRESRLHLIPNGVDAARLAVSPGFDRRTIRSGLFGADEGDVVVGMVGRLWRQKNPTLLVRAAAVLAASGLTHVRFVFVGDGELAEHCMRLAIELGVADRLSFLGWRTDVADILHALDIFTLPSLWEGMPLAILEAMACGLPVVASNIAGNADLIVDGQDGALFTSDDHLELARQLEPLVRSRDLRIAAGQRGRDKAMKHYSLEQRNRRVEALYVDLIGKG